MKNNKNQSSLKRENKSRNVASAEASAQGESTPGTKCTIDESAKKPISIDSKYQEQIIEYKFVAELMEYLLFKNKKLEILRVHTDSFGYDLILKVDDTIRYVQLKSRLKAGKAQYWDVHKPLLKNELGRVVIIYFDIENNKLSLVYNYLELGKYKSTMRNEPKYKKDPSKYCRVCAKDLSKNRSIADVSKWLLNV